MKALVPVVVVAVFLSSTSVRAAEPAHERSAVSALGVVLAGLGVAGLGVGLAGTLITSDATQTLHVYAPDGAPNQADAGIVAVFSRRQAQGSTLAIGGFISGAALLLGGLVCLLLDAPRGVSLAVVPGREGLTLSAQLQF